MENPFYTLMEIDKTMEYGTKHVPAWLRESLQSHTSFAVIFKASQSTLGRMLHRKEGLYSMSDCSSSQSWKWSGNDSGDVLQALTAQVRKLTVSIFIVVVDGDW